MACDITKLCVNCDAENATLLHPLVDELEKYRPVHPYLVTNRPRLFCSKDCLRQNCREWEIPLLQLWLKELRRFPKSCKEKERLINLSCKTVENLLARNSTFRLFFTTTKKELAAYELNLKIKFWGDVHGKISVLEQKQQSRRAELVLFQKKLDEESRKVAAIESQIANCRLDKKEFVEWATVVKQELDPLKTHIRDVSSKIDEWMREIDGFATTKQEIYDNLESPPDTVLELLTFWVDEMNLMAPNFI